jgi:hypothetical protein
VVHPLAGTIQIGEAYSKTVVMQRLGISQKFWDKMLDDGLPFTEIGHSRWVSGKHLLDYLEQHAETKKSDAQRN